MFNRSKPFIPLDVWLSITPHLQPQDVLNASMTCRDWYISLAHRCLWQPIFDTVLPGYPSNHFLIPQSVENAKRLDFIPLDGSEPRFLDHWPQSWKQRTVYLQHVMQVQSKAVKALRENTPSFEEHIKAPIFDMARIKEMEDIIQSAMPIDLVVYMYHFAHHLPAIQTGRYKDEDVLPIASGDVFESRDEWQKLHNTFDIRRYVRHHPSTSQFHLQEVSCTTIEYMLQFKFTPFAQLDENGGEDDKSGLAVMLSKNDSPPADLPPFVAADEYEINLEGTINSIGKAFILTSHEGVYVLQYIAESFTDYFLQYTGVALNYGEVPHFLDEGTGDLCVDLPRDNSPRMSVLLPQPIDCWDIDSYFPTYFTRWNYLIFDTPWKEEFFNNVNLQYLNTRLHDDEPNNDISQISDLE